MAAENSKLTAAVETCLTDLGRVHASGGATGERSSYGPLVNLLNAVGASHKPKVFCVGEFADTPVPGVTQAPLKPETAAVAVPATAGGRNMAGGDFAVTAGWGHGGQGDAVMPGQGRAAERGFSPDERAAMGDALPALGDTTFDIYLNEDAFWSNVRAAVWNYRLSGYQVLKKWLSYRERPILGRPLKLEEIQHFTNMARRIQEIIMSMHQGLTRLEGFH